jgi:hypothetical protein
VSGSNIFGVFVFKPTESHHKFLQICGQRMLVYIQDCVFTIYETTHLKFPDTNSERNHKLRRIAMQKEGPKHKSAHSLSIKYFLVKELLSF